MKHVSGYFVCVLLYWTLRYFFYEGHEALFQIARGCFFAYLLYKLLFFFRNRPTEEDLNKTFQKFVYARFGKLFGGYLIYEIRLLIGALRFFASPVKSFRGISTSYFANSYLNGFLIFIVFMLVLEPALLHLLLAKTLHSNWTTTVHIILILFELWAIELLFGNLYYLQFSKIECLEDRVTIEMGLLWKLSFQLQDIEGLEFSNFEDLKPKVPKIALENSVNLRIYFKSRLSAERMVGTKDVIVLDLFLRDKELAFFRNWWFERA